MVNLEIFDSFQWIKLEEGSHASDELVRETKKNRKHKLQGIDVMFLAQSQSSDDFLIFVPERSEYGVVHLTYNQETDPSFPWYEVMDDHALTELKSRQPDWFSDIDSRSTHANQIPSKSKGAIQWMLTGILCVVGIWFGIDCGHQSTRGEIPLTYSWEKIRKIGVMIGHEDSARVLYNHYVARSSSHNDLLEAARWNDYGLEIAAPWADENMSKIMKKLIAEHEKAAEQQQSGRQP